MKYVIAQNNIVNNQDLESINNVTIRISDSNDATQNEYVLYFDDNEQNVSDFFTMLRIGYQGTANTVKNVILTVA